jgi:hypothetical protein
MTMRMTTRKPLLTEEQFRALKSALEHPSVPPISAGYTSRVEVVSALAPQIRALSRAGYPPSQIAEFFAASGLTVSPTLIARFASTKRKRGAGKSAVESAPEVDSTPTEDGTPAEESAPEVESTPAPAAGAHQFTAYSDADI